jgi:hypothetical protein
MGKTLAMSNVDDLLLGADETADWTPASDARQRRPPTAGVPQDVTLVEVLNDLTRQGYTTEFSVDADGSLCCRVCGICAAPGTADVQSFRRLEGASDPGDMAAVLAVRCRACSSRGAAVVRFGPEAGPGDAALLEGMGPL